MLGIVNDKSIEESWGGESESQGNIFSEVAAKQ